MPTIALLIASKLFMTIAWYGHLKFPDATLWKVIIVSWLIAALEYCLAVPANRLDYVSDFTVGQLKVM